jgi:AraC-like DNA-binding protein
MPRKRQTATKEADPEESLEIRSLAGGYPSGFVIDAHVHDWHQLVYATHGVMAVNTNTGSWVVPSQRAVWVPAGIEHEVEMIGQVSMRTLYIRERLSASLPSDCCVVNVSPLLRELITHTIEIGMLDRRVPEQSRLIGVILDQLHRLPTVPLKLSMPNDRRALQLAELMREKPGDVTPLEQISKQVGASKRTIERLFQAETQMSFGKWRQQLRLLHALRLLASGESVTAAAYEVGYDSTSAFIAAFKTVLGTTPGRYYADSQRQKRR